ncbi:MAG: endonuclease domain-containing protein [Sphingomonadales bacterium]|nr:endonuclease domain-containing protein [Sphingomonadales bacterium]
MARKIIPYKPYLKGIAQKLRNNSSKPEIIFWNQIKQNKCKGYDFHRQKPLLNYIVDFYCPELNLIIEIDGKYHDSENQSEKDAERDEALKEWNLTVIRIAASEILNDVSEVMGILESQIDSIENKINREN